MHATAPLPARISSRKHALLRSSPLTLATLIIQGTGGGTGEGLYLSVGSEERRGELVRHQMLIKFFFVFEYRFVIPAGTRWGCLQGHIIKY